MRVPALFGWVGPNDWPIRAAGLSKIHGHAGAIYRRENGGNVPVFRDESEALAALDSLYRRHGPAWALANPQDAAIHGAKR